MLFGIAAAEGVDAYTTASATKTVLTGDALAEAEAVLAAQSSLLSTVDEAKAEGYQYVEAYPVQDGGYLGMAFTGPVHMYEKAGFVTCARICTTYIMRKKLC